MLILMRGISGSGKTEVARSLLRQGEADCIISTNDYFMDSLGRYNFDGGLLVEAHDWCYRGVELSLAYGLRVIVDNTFVDFEHAKPYLELAKRFDVPICVALPNTPWQHNVNECFRRGIHGVPLSTLERQLEKYRESDMYYAFYTGGARIVT